MNIVDILALVASLACVFAYVCRFDVLVAWRHHPAIWAMHIALGAIAADAGVKAAHGATDLQAVLCLMASGGWIIVSRSSWANGVPAHYYRRDLHLAHSGEPSRVVAKIKP